MIVEIPLKLPSLNDYVNECRRNRFAGANMKKYIEEDIAVYLIDVPEYDGAVRLNFTWYEGNKRRDFDNVCFAKKFILDALVKSGKLKEDNRKIVTGFTDNFVYGDDWKVVVEIEEV